MKTNLLKCFFACIGIILFTGCSSDELLTEENSSEDGVSLRHALVLQPNSNVDNLAIMTFPNSFPPFNYPAGYNQTGLPNTSLEIYAWTHSGYYSNGKATLKFNILSYLNSTNKINKATLKLKSVPGKTPLNQLANHGSANAFYVQQITSYYTAASITSSGLPSVSNQVTVPHTNATMQDVEIDVTTLVRNMVNSNRDYGFLLRLVNETRYNCRYFCSSTYPDVSMRPSLTIDFD